jgi:hypothetical protein
MRYVVGVRTVERSTGCPVEGLFCYDKLGLPFILPNRANPKSPYPKLPVFSSVDDAQAFLSYLSKRYYKDFAKEAIRLNAHRSHFAFFLLKVDSSNFKRNLIKIENYKSKITAEYKTAEFYYIES